MVYFLPFMKKNYKPLNKTPSAFRRKTIDPRIDLGIKKDEDGLENIDDYWRVAESILEADSVSEVEVNQKNDRVVINSLDSNVDMASSVNFSMLSLDEPPKDDFKFTTLEQKKDEDTLYNIAEIKERLSHKTINSNVETITNSLPNTISNTSGFEESNPQPLKENVANAEKKVEKKVTNVEKKVTNVEREGTNVEKKVTNVERKATNVKKSSKEIKRIYDSINGSFMHKRNKIQSLGNPVDEFISKKDPVTLFTGEDTPVGLTNISSFYEGKSKLFSLVKSDTFETAALHLNPDAKILDDLAYTSFSLYLIKGSLDITVDGKSFTAKRDTVLCIEKDSKYSFINNGRRVAEAIITYCIKSE